METDTTASANQTGQSKGKFFARVLPHIARVLMGLMFFVFGLNGFLNFMPPPKDMPQDIIAVTGALAKKGGFMTVVSGTQLLVGVLLLLNRFVPLALASLRQSSSASSPSTSPLRQQPSVPGSLCWSWSFIWPGRIGARSVPCSPRE